MHDIDRCRSVVELVKSPLGWTWRLELDGTKVAVASRLYSVERVSDYNLRAFLNTVPVAVKGLLVAG